MKIYIKQIDKCLAIDFVQRFHYSKIMPRLTKYYQPKFNMNVFYHNYQEGGGQVMAYRNLKTNELVMEEDAYDYAFEKCMDEEYEEFREMLVEWYFSGNWIKESE